MKWILKNLFSVLLSSDDKKLKQQLDKSNIKFKISPSGTLERTPTPQGE